MRYPRIALEPHLALVAGGSMLALALSACTGVVGGSGVGSGQGSGITGSGARGGPMGSTTGGGGTAQSEALPPRCQCRGCRR